MMANTQDQEQREPLNNTNARTPDLAPSPSPTPSPSPQPLSQGQPPVATSSRHRITYARAPSISFMEATLVGPAANMSGGGESSDRTPVVGHGLGIGVTSESPPAKSASTQAIKRTPVGHKRDSAQRTPDSAKLLLSPTSSSGLSGSTRFNDSFEDVDVSYGAASQLGKQSSYSLESNNAPSMSQSSKQGLLGPPSTTSIRELYNDFSQPHVCSSAKHFRRGMNNWLAITIIA